jgi:hypothetical protein
MTGLSTWEAAEALGITTNTLKSRVGRARAAIRLYFRKMEAANVADESKVPVMNRTAMRATIEMFNPPRIQNEALIGRALCCLSRNQILAKHPQVSHP